MSGTENRMQWGGRMEGRLAVRQRLKRPRNAYVDFGLHLTEQSLCSSLSDGKEFLSGLNLTFDEAKAK